ncbi:hypothetical protein A3A64_00155 [Candidatus Gottesmanbacteria bacterium RIFCSPLOWO2_01_FULL_48_11]|uniref:Uncharacterized protein n=1 Tax=Candidatus Gottesmanbacteria bacterium RIFCSPLOWO2_01_FULL_48_11 TaxID=1798395 RepID=A0A1F6AUL9_9BACT|nr:MAG: hypothetical protein A3A64_00155 [Candidatus Gottesmanbacteria bacterium RIFCSPLOWO2_01_FULL_48_11]
MLNYEHEQQRVIAAIADIFDLEPSHFEVKWNSDNPAEPVEIVGGNVMALAYGRHNIPLDKQDWEVVSLPVK